MSSSNKALVLGYGAEPYFGHLSDEELLRHLQFNNTPVVAELVKRFEGMIDRKEEERIEELQDKRNWAVACVSEYAGEDKHSGVIRTLQSALTKNKPDMKQAMQSAIEELGAMDYGAARMIEAMLDGSAD